MTAVFQLFLQMSVGASVIVLAVLAVRLLLRRAPKWFAYLLWSAVLLRLVLPVGFASAFSIYRWMGGREQQPIGLGYLPDPSGWSDYGLARLPATIDWARAQLLPVEQSHGIGLSALLQIGTVIWLAGIVALLAWTLIMTLKLRQRVRYATRVRDHIYECETVDTPFVFGLFRPRIYLPSGLQEQESAYMIMHEQTHLARGDHWIKALAFGLLILHWFNPLLWVAYTQMNKDMEMSCDERVLRKMGPAIRHNYARSLLALASNKNSAGLLAFGQNHVKARIIHVLRVRPVSLRMNLLYGILAVIVLTGCTTNPLPMKQTVIPVSGDYEVEQLLASQTPYVGDASKVGSLIMKMASPEQMSGSIMQLHTSERPYGVTMHYEWTALTPVEIDGPTERLFYRNAMLLLSLIDNVDAIHFHIVDQPSADISEDEGITISYTRQQAEAAYGDVRQYAQDADALQRFIDRLQSVQ